MGRRTAEAKATTKLALNLIPLVGPVLAQAINLYESERRNRKLDALIDEIRSQLGRLDQTKLDSDFINTPGFQEAAFRAFEAGRTTSDAEKRRLIAAALVGAATVDRPSGLDVEAILDTLRVLTPTDLDLARKLWDEAGGNEPKSIVTSVIGPPGFPDREFHLKRLEAAGLISSTAGQHLDWAGQYQLTGTFHLLMVLVGMAATPPP